MRFGDELAQRRREKKWTQFAVSSRLGVHQTLISQWERAIKAPGPGYAERLDRIFGLADDGIFTAHYNRILRAVNNPAWFMQWAEHVERQAVALRFWDPLLVTGLLQTPEYAYAIFRGAPGATPAWVEERVSVRLSRKVILEREKPPTVLSLIEESVLHRPVGGPDVLAGQLQYLLKVAERPNVTIQVVPQSVACTAGMVSGFGLAKLPLDPDMATLESLTGGLVSADTELLAKLHQRYDTIRADAYSQRESMAMIRDVIKL
ncbi:helix-turn-helix transcriptional regulator [Spongiactinospora sp. TRM90649]|uniref:helix-turn-helix domain-containing protein n=1 Tax=Spongiactinospora sp. TRM90649 TaxID=3031114 RepID=UPI0023F6414D|nr:helix-turn-helix transcriptional regulator [Spongiactinospora sp. TRM90649]MDF5754665.1 helix-turn-helix transcriptional regulator [Spongiactinospora sp. TRM90649]